MSKVFYDDTLNKEVSDLNGTMTKQDCVDNHGFSSVANTQEVTVNGTTAVAEVVAGALQTFDAVVRADADATTRETERQTAEDNTKTVLGITQAEYDDLVRSMR